VAKINKNIFNKLFANFDEKCIGKSFNDSSLTEEEKL
jgi:hypothetical protein